MKAYWLSWYGTPDTGPFTLEWPWWISGHRLVGRKRTDGEIDVTQQDPTICAAVRAESEEAAKEIILAAHDRRPGPGDMVWRFCEEQPDGWSPFSERFPRADWMVWND